MGSCVSLHLTTQAIAHASQMFRADTLLSCRVSALVEDALKKMFLDAPLPPMAVFEHPSFSVALIGL